MFYTKYARVLSGVSQFSQTCFLEFIQSCERVFNCVKH